MNENKFSAMVVGADKSSAELIKSYLNEVKEIDSCELLVGFDVEKIETKTLLVVDARGLEDLEHKLIEVRERCPQTLVVVVSDRYDVKSVIKLMRVGVKDFLPKPITRGEFLKSIKRLLSELLVPMEVKNNCRVLSVFSNKGGIGKTSVAVNLALELANITKERVALVDLNLQLGDVATFLDLKPTFDIAYVLQNLNKADDKFLLNTLERYRDTNLYVLADPCYMEKAKDVTVEQISQLFNRLRQTFSYVVVDTGANFDGKTICALDNTDLILLMSIVNLPAIRNCQRCLDVFDRLGYEKERATVILNRYMDNDELNVEDVERTLGKKVYWKIPNNYFTIMTAINKGVPVSYVNEQSNISQSYRELAITLVDNMYKQKLVHKIKRNPLIDFNNLK